MVCFNHFTTLKLHYNMERMESSAHTHNDKLELDVGYMFRSSRRLVYCLCCENICKLKMLFVFGLRSFHNLVVETSWLQGLIFWYLDLLWGNSGIWRCDEMTIDNGHISEMWISKLGSKSSFWLFITHVLFYIKNLGIGSWDIIDPCVWVW